MHATVAKQHIAQLAVREFLRPNMVVAMDGGTTVAATLPHMSNLAGVSVLTNSLEIVRQAPPYLSVYNSGGLYRPVSGTFVGPQAVAFFSQHRADLAFISATALHEEEGLMDPNALEIEVKRTLCQRAERIILLLDQSKCGRRSTLQVLPWTAIHALVTDAPPPRPFHQALEEAGVYVCC